MLLATGMLIVFLPQLRAQNAGIGTGTPHASAQLDITAPGKGILIPRMRTSSVTGIASPAKGLTVYDSTKNKLLINIGTAVVPFWQNAAASWSLTGNTGTNTAVNFMGTTDNQPLLFKIQNRWSGFIDSASNSTYLGWLSGRDSSGNPANTAFGAHALQTDIKATGFNTALGNSALSLNSTGYYNTAVGQGAMYKNQSGARNTAIGRGALFTSNKGFENTAVGYFALYHAWTAPRGITPSYNTAIGTNSFWQNSSGRFNTVNGYYALYTQTQGDGNTATGIRTMYTMWTGNYNTTEGRNSMFYSYSGDYNTILGADALYSVTNTAERFSTYQNTSVGYRCLATTRESDGNTAFGYNAGSAYNNGYYNCFIGSETDAANANLYNTIALGHATTVSLANVMRVGNPATSSIGGPVGWSTLSDRRAKKNIKENIPGLSFILKLRPVTYNINTAAIETIERGNAQQSAATAHDTSRLMAEACKARERIVYTGFIAQEVEQAAKSINYDFNGVDAPQTNQQLYALRYEAFVMPLVKSIQELSVQNNQLTSSSAVLKTEYQKIQERLDALDKKLKR